MKWTCLSFTQCPAVTIVLLDNIDPPQMWLKLPRDDFALSEICHGNSPSEAFLPPTTIECISSSFGTSYHRLPHDSWSSGLLEPNESKQNGRINDKIIIFS